MESRAERGQRGKETKKQRAKNITPEPTPNLMEVKHQIQFTHRRKELVEQLHKQVDAFKVCEFVVARVHRITEVQTRVAPVYQFVRAKLQVTS